MKKYNFTRRQFIATTSVGAIGAIVTHRLPSVGKSLNVSDKLALVGGSPVRSSGWMDWPVWDPEAEDSMLTVLRSGKWYREWGNLVSEFEKKYAGIIGAKRALATASGTTALETALHVLGVDAGDEVIVSPYTFIATYNVVFNQKALPVFADTDQETFTINPDKIEAKITDRTKAILPVHILGLPADMNRINAIAKKHSLVVIEDACQAWLAEYDGKKCGTLGDLGCFSFQNSKHLPSGEGGAITGNDDKLMDLCYSYHNCGRPYGNSASEYSGYPFRGGNKRMMEIQAVILLSQMKRLQKDADKRLENARYLDSKLKNIPGIIPYKLADGATRSAYHLYPFRYKKEQFDGLPREKFLKALSAEGIPCSEGYGPQYNDGLMEEALNSTGYKRLFSKQRLDAYREELKNLPDNDQLTREAVWLFQNMLLGDRKDMNDIVNAIQKIFENREQLL
ncbi:MAG: DegT/DnrJ/EryC1/StrS family aminotransferase [Cyclobacteriaceae bacterium]|nr:DegT/DnrJ/EryC1/StrS family aminotransferase [Cyclobacteriaceae bacterium]